MLGGLSLRNESAKLCNKLAPHAFSLPPSTRPALTDAGVPLGVHWDRPESGKSKLAAGVKSPKADKAAGSSLPAGSAAPVPAHLPLALARLHPEEQEKDVQHMDFHTTRHGMRAAHQSPPSLVRPVLSHKPVPCLSHVPCLTLFSLPLCSATRPALTNAGCRRSALGETGVEQV